jgi:hypothetical protein
MKTVRDKYQKCKEQQILIHCLNILIQRNNVINFYELSLPARTLESWVQIPLEAWMCAFILCLCCSACR